MKQIIIATLILAAPAAVAAQTTRITGPTVIVTAQKEPADPQTLPVSVTVVTGDTLRNTGISWIGEAAPLAPSTFFSEFTARKLSNARFRGIGSSPANPGVTTFIDGVPQLNANTSSMELVAVNQVEFVRGPQSALFGRNTLGGLINIASTRPSTSEWTGSVWAPALGNFAARDVRAEATGPITSRLSVGAAIGRSVRDGYTVNDLTGNTLDDRAGTYGKGQLLWTPTDRFELRAIVSGERARDGDYALGDLEQLRQNPYHVSRDFEGRTDRDVMSYTVLSRTETSRLSLTTTTGVVRWSTFDLTDLDYTPLPLIQRENDESATQFTQEVRVASAANAPLQVGDAVTLRWQGGVFLFAQGYDQDAVNAFSPGVLSPFVLLPIRQHSPQAALDDSGVGLFGQGTLSFGSNVDVTVGARFDHENKDASLITSFEPAFAPPITVATEEGFSNVSPQLALTYRLDTARMLYASLSRGFKAGGFNPTSPAGAESYDEEHTWNLEGGVKTSWREGRLTANLAAFHINWQNLQTNLPNLQVPGQFYIANAGSAYSAGLEVEVAARPIDAIDLFATLGVTRARFDEGSASSGVDVSGNELPSTPDFTASFGAQLTHALNSRVSLYGRGDAVLYGAFKYDDMNLQGQDAYSVANFRIGARGGPLFVEGWIRNAFDSRYVPIAFAYGALAPSGFIGEMGRPRTFGVSGGVAF